MLRKLYIEPTTKCNLNCKMCFRHTWFDEPMCDLSLEDYRQVLRKIGYCKFVREGMTFVRADGKVSPCMALLHNSYTYLHDFRRKITHCSFGNIREASLSEIWNSKEYRAFRRKFDEFDFASCLYCGHCELFEEIHRFLFDTPINAPVFLLSLLRWCNNPTGNGRLPLLYGFLHLCEKHDSVKDIQESCP